MEAREGAREPELLVRLEGRTLDEIIHDLPLGRELATREVGPLEVLFAEGQEGEVAYLILEGTVYIEKTGPQGAVRQLARFQRGDLFGEMAILDDPVRSATARGGPRGASLVELPRTVLDRVFTEAPNVARWLLKVLSHRLRVMTKLSGQMEQIQDINRRIIEGQDQERRRIARDIHDGPAQAFADYVMRLQIIERLVDRDTGQAKQEIQELVGSINEGLDRLRGLIHGLHTKDFRTSGLEVAVQRFVDRLAEDASFEVEVEFEKSLTDRLPDHLSNTMYCLVQEAMNNIRKHAEARQVRIRLEGTAPEACVLRVEDDGKGFDAPALLAAYHERESLGMTSMQERAELAGGQMEIDSEPGAGTRLAFSFPLAEGASA